MKNNGYYFTEQQINYLRDLAAGPLNQINTNGAAAQMQLAIDLVRSNQKLFNGTEPKTGRPLREVFLEQTADSTARKACTILKCYLIDAAMAMLCPQLTNNRPLPPFYIWWMEGIEAGNIGIHVDPHFYWQENENALIYPYLQQDRYLEFRRGPSDNDANLLDKITAAGLPVIGIRDGQTATDDSHSFIALRMPVNNEYRHVMIDTFHEMYNGKPLRWSVTQETFSDEEPMRFGPQGPRWCHIVYSHFASLDSSAAALYDTIHGV